MRLKRLGFTDNMSELDAVTAEYFIEIAMTYSKLETEKMKQQTPGM